MSTLPLIRSHERIDYKRCPKKWFWKWRLGLTPKAKEFGALELGTWMHEALARFYTGTKQDLQGYFQDVTDSVLHPSIQLPDHVRAQAEEQVQLGLAMSGAYDLRYGNDPGVNVIDAEVPLEFEISDTRGKVVALHKLKPDLVYADQHGDVWLMEHKTAASIRTEHLVIDDQARPYVAMAGRALANAGVIKDPDQFKGVMYNFLRKAVPDSRPMNEKGEYLNKNGSVSKSQPPPYFVRHPVVLARPAKRRALECLQSEAMLVTGIAQDLRNRTIDPLYLPKTPHSSCPRFCQYFVMCVVEEQGGDIREMQRSMYTQVNPYTYDEENPTSDVPVSFEMG